MFSLKVVDASQVELAVQKNSLDLMFFSPSGFRDIVSNADFSPLRSHYTKIIQCELPDGPVVIFTVNHSIRSPNTKL